MQTFVGTLKKAIFEVFADMFYLFPEEADVTNAFPENVQAFSIGLQGEGDLTITCCFTRELGQEMAANFLGEKQDQIADFLVEETLKEAVNVIAGRVLIELSGVWSLGFPYPFRGDLTTLQQTDRSILLRIAEEPFLAAMTSRK